MNATRAKDLEHLPDAMVEEPSPPVSGRNSRIAWQRGFCARCWTKTTQGFSTPPRNRYIKQGLAECYALGWRAANELIEARRGK